MSKSVRKGFTLIELVLVLFIIGVASALAVGLLYRSMDNVRLKTSAKELSVYIEICKKPCSGREKDIFLCYEQ